MSFLREPEGIIVILIYNGIQSPINVALVPRIGEEVVPPTGGPTMVVSNVRHNLTGADETPTQMNYGISVYLTPRLSQVTDEE